MYLIINKAKRLDYIWILYAELKQDITNQFINYLLLTPCTLDRYTKCAELSRLVVVLKRQVAVTVNRQMLL